MNVGYVRFRSFLIANIVLFSAITASIPLLVHTSTHLAPVVRENSNDLCTLADLVSDNWDPGMRQASRVAYAYFKILPNGAISELKTELPSHSFMPDDAKGYESSIDHAINAISGSSKIPESMKNRNIILSFSYCRMSRQAISVKNVSAGKLKPYY